MLARYFQSDSPRARFTRAATIAAPVVSLVGILAAVAPGVLAL
jgi:hypothetical protein